MALIRRIDPAEARALIAELDAYQENLYPPESNHLDSIEQLSTAVMFGAFDNDALVAIGAVKLLGDYGEIKRFYVPEPFRGNGYAKAVLAALEQYLSAAGIDIVRLETGVYQAEAIGLYRRNGYIERGPFGSYLPDPLSIFMEKDLSPPSVQQTTTAMQHSKLKDR